jgi:uncharacterized protein with GYD domain
LKGLFKDKASGRLAAIRQTLDGFGGKLEAAYFALGHDDVVLIVDLPDIVVASAISLAVSASGLVKTRTTALLTIEETDKALATTVRYRAPGG